MGSEYERDRDKGTLEISQTQFIQSVLNRFGVSKSSLIPATPSLDLRNVSEETVVGVPFREIVGSLMWVANQTRPDIANAVRAIARFCHDPKPIHHKATQTILEYLNSTPDLGPKPIRRDNDLASVQLDFDLETYVDVDYGHKAEDRRSVSGVAVCCGGALVSWFSRTQKCVTLSTTEAEYIAIADGAKEALHVRGILAFLMPILRPMSIGVHEDNKGAVDLAKTCLLYTSPSPRDQRGSRMPSSA